MGFACRAPGAQALSKRALGLPRTLTLTKAPPAPDTDRALLPHRALTEEATSLLHTTPCCLTASLWLLLQSSSCGIPLPFLPWLTSAGGKEGSFSR